jgi:hypothetical protein
MIKTKSYSEAAKIAATAIISCNHVAAGGATVGEAIQYILMYIADNQNKTGFQAAVSYMEEVLELVFEQVDETTAVF